MANMIQTYSITDYGKTSVNVRHIELEPFGKTTGQSFILTEHLVQDKILVPNIARGDIVEVDMGKKQIVKKLFPAGSYDYMVVIAVPDKETINVWGPKYGYKSIYLGNKDVRRKEIHRDDEVLVQEDAVFGSRIVFNLTVAANQRQIAEKYANKVY